jgi:hypothetical protein
MGAINGTINVSDIKLDYKGGNKTISVTIRNLLNTLNVTRYINLFYSRWDYTFGSNKISYLEFIPSSPTSKNVKAYGQTNSTPILNITNYGYGGNANLSVSVDGTYPCINLTISTDNNKSHGYLLNTSWVTLTTNSPYLKKTQIWMWADYGCNYTSWKVYTPDLYFRQCAINSFCSEEII